MARYTQRAKVIASLGVAMYTHRAKVIASWMWPGILIGKNVLLVGRGQVYPKVKG